MSFANTHHSAAPTQLSNHYLTASNSYGPATPTMMVHTPYSCEHDLVPTGSEVASQLGASMNEDQASASFGVNNLNNTWGNNNSNSFLRYGSNGSSIGHTATSSQPQSHQASATKMSRRSPNHQGSGSNNSTPQPEMDRRRSSFDPWTGESSYTQSNNITTTQNDDNNNEHYPAFMMRAPIVNAPVHSAHLGGKAEYLEIPLQDAELTTPAQWNRQFKVFVGHVKFEISADGLRWLIYMLTGVHAGKIEVRGMGCFMVFFASTDEVFRVRGLHKRVLFDVNGIWFAQNQAQEELLHSYAANVAPSIHAKLPKGLMVVDEETSRRRSKKSAASKTHTAAVAAADVVVPVPQQYNHHQSQQPQQYTQGGFKSHAAVSPPPHSSATEMWAAQSDGGSSGSHQSSHRGHY